MSKSACWRRRETVMPDQFTSLNIAAMSIQYSTLMDLEQKQFSELIIADANGGLLCLLSVSFDLFLSLSSLILL